MGCAWQDAIAGFESLTLASCRTLDTLPVLTVPRFSLVVMGNEIAQSVMVPDVL